MNDKQNAILNMMQNVYTVMQANAAKYENIPVIKTSVETLGGQVTAIREHDQTRTETKVRAATADKQSEQDTMINNTVILARIVNVYAQDTKNTTLQMQSAVNKSQLYQVTHNECLALAKTVLQQAQANATALQDYGLEPSMTETLATAVAAFESLLVKPRGIINEKKGQTQTLAQLFADGKSLLFDRLDKLMSRFKTSDADFYNAYFAARNVINTAYRKAPAATDARNNAAN